MEEEEVPVDIHAGEELLPATISIGEGGLFNPHMVATKIRPETSKEEELEDLKNTIGSYTLSNFGGGSHGGPNGWGGFVGGEYKATGGRIDFPLPWVGGRRGDFAGGFTGGGLGDIVGDLGGGYCGLAGGVHSDFEGVFAGKVERGGKTTVGGVLNRKGVFLRGGSGASGSGGGPGCWVAREESGKGYETDYDRSGVGRGCFAGTINFPPSRTVGRYGDFSSGFTCGGIIVGGGPCSVAAGKSGGQESCGQGGVADDKSSD